MAQYAGLTVALLAATLAMLAGLLLAKLFPLRMGADLEVTPAPLEHLLVASEPDPEAGPRRGTTWRSGEGPFRAAQAVRRIGCESRKRASSNSTINWST